MTLKLINLNLILLLVSCSFSFDKEIINYGSDLRSINAINIKKGETQKSFIIKKLGPPSFTNPYDKKNVYYISQEMVRKIGKVNQFQKAIFLEIIYDKDDKVVEFYYKKEDLPNDVSLSKSDEKSIAEDRTTFEFLRNILSNLRRNQN